MSQPDLMTQTLQFVEASSIALKRAMDDRAVYEAGRVKAAVLVPNVLDALVAAGAVPENQKKAAEALIISHEGTLNMLKAAAAKIGELKTALEARPSPKDLGGPVDEKAAGAGNDRNGAAPPTGPYVGRRTTEVRDSDRRLAAHV